MAVYVDDMRAGFGRMIMCHMIADTTQELDAMAQWIGISPRWKQYPNTTREHYDVCLSKRKLAVKAGAIEVSQRELVQRMRAK